MFSGKNKNRSGRRGVHRINLRITVLFSVFFALTAVLLLGGIYYTVKTSLDQEDLQFIQQKLLEYWAQSQTQSIENFINNMDGNAMQLEGTPYFLRIADKENRTIFFMFPQGWKDFFPENLFEDALKPSEGILHVASARRSYKLTAAGIHLNDDYILQIGVSTEKSEKIIRHIIRNFAVLLVPLLLLSALGGSFLTAGILAPIQKLTEAAGNIVDTGNLRARIQESRAQDELHDLVSLFNRMLEHIEALVRGMQGTLDAVAHDLRTPLTRFRAMAELALRGPEDLPRFREALQDGLEEADMIITQLNAIMDLSEAETGTLRINPEPVNIAELTKQIIEMYSYIAEERNVRIDFSGPEKLFVAADAARWRRIAGNILDNAVKYSPGGKTVFVELRMENDGLALTVRDEGPGIPPEELSHIWKRLYRGAGARKKPGLGIGLSIAKAITEAQGGKIRVESRPGAGAVFCVKIPLGEIKVT
jgi:signal transduction histidine kinase